MEATRPKLLEPLANALVLLPKRFRIKAAEVIKGMLGEIMKPIRNRTGEPACAVFPFPFHRVLAFRFTCLTEYTNIEHSLIEQVAVRLLHPHEFSIPSAKQAPVL